jgi:hypothetical protein
MACSRMNRQILDPDKVRVIRLQADLVRELGFFLAGGLGLALRLGHGLSRAGYHRHPSITPLPQRSYEPDSAGWP